ncbi:MAG: hypothetical protein CPSOU_3448 [uncultured Paraburkholderia sp.]|nr:MAG: hypothetical protein CPSOU_3448 [uncultured Paraburkholderia sp.]
MLVVTPKRLTPASGVATPMRGRTPLETGSQMLLRYLLRGSESPLAATGIVGEFPDKIFRRRFRPGAQYVMTAH